MLTAIRSANTERSISTVVSLSRPDDNGLGEHDVPALRRSDELEPTETLPNGAVRADLPTATVAADIASLEPGHGVHMQDGKATTLAAERYAIEIDHVCKTFGSNAVMNCLDLTFREGAITTVLGPSGTGKSVLIKHILGLMFPDSGDVRVFGKSIPSLSDPELLDLRREFGVLFQDGALFGSMNIYDNVAFPLRQHTDYPEERIRDIVMSRLQEVGLEAAARKMPSQISGGMRKRAGFARALVTDPKILMFDEPDSGLDPVRTSLLNDLILRVHEEFGGTYLIVTHDINTARKVSDDLAVIWKGRAVFCGPAATGFSSEDPFVRQFLAGHSAGPLGMD
jgi:phospholipid/cholesterol/gamma-HCH transport system ATP-binding protein